jgi:hypothetical protein
MMTESDIHDTSPAAGTAASPVSEPDAAERTYPISRQGRRQALILLLGVVTVWIFALWTLITILQDGVSGVEWVSLALMLGLLVVAPLVAWALLEEAYSSITVSDRGIRYRTLAGINLDYAWDDFSGFAPTGGRSRIARFFLGDDDTDGSNESNLEARAQAEDIAPLPAEPETAQATDPPELADDAEDEEEAQTLLLRARHDHTGQIANPAIRLLHKLGHGAALPIYGGLEDRRELLDEVGRRLNKEPNWHNNPNTNT